MSDRKQISISPEVFEEAKANKGDRTWDELVLDGAHADETEGRNDEGQNEGHPTPLTAEDIPMLRREIGEEVENRMTRR